MPARENIEAIGHFLPFGWEQAWDPSSNRYFYVDHNTKTTTWLNPIDQRTKPKSISECDHDRLPYGWERVDDPTVGTYYTNHIEKRNQWSNPVTDWLNHLSKLNQHHYSNSHNMSSEQLADSFDSDTHQTSLSVTIDKPDNSYQTSDLDKSANSLNNSTSPEADAIGTSRSNNSTRGSKYDTSLLDIMDSRFNRGSSHSVQV